jgi:hypothetical protein
MEIQEKKRGRPKGCSSCKKKKVVTELEPLDNTVELIMKPSNEDIKLAYHELTNMKGVQEDKKPFINYVYSSIFNEPFDWSCIGCANTQARKLEAYCKKNEIKL